LILNLLLFLEYEVFEVKLLVAEMYVLSFSSKKFKPTTHPIFMASWIMPTILDFTFK
jgi:hypothetical protein